VDRRVLDGGRESRGTRQRNPYWDNDLQEALWWLMGGSCPDIALL